MKKLFITILAIFYLGVSSGATLHVHHCMGELVEWGFSDNSLDDDGKCTSCGMRQGNSDFCCKSQKQELKLKESHKASSNVFQIQIFEIFPPKYFLLPILAIPKVNEENTDSHLVLRKGSIPPFLRNCNFRI